MASVVSFTIKLKDSISAGLNKIKAGISNVQHQMDKATSTTHRYASICQKLSAPNLAAIADIADRLGSSFASASQAGFSFSQSMADLSAITGITGKDLENLESQARRIGASSGLGADAAARAFSTLASQIEISRIGIDGLNLLQEKSVTLAQASGMALDDAAVALAATVNQFGLGADHADRVINVLAAGSKFGAAEIADLAASFKITGSAASAMGLSVEETAGALEILSQANLKGSEAGTALRNIILKLNTELGIDLSQTSLGTALDALKPRLTDATYLSKVFGIENIAAAQFLIQNAEAVDLMTQKVTDTSTAQEQAAIRTSSTAQRMAELRAQIDNVKIGLTDFFGSASPYIAVITENAANLVFMGQAIASCSKAFIALKSVMSSVVAIQARHIATLAMQKASLLAAKTATTAVALATKAWSGIQMALNAVLTANPIGIVIMAVTALVAAIVYAYNHSESFRNLLNRIWLTVSDVAIVIWNGLVKAFDAVTGAIKKAWIWLKNFLGISSDTSDIDAQTNAINSQTDAINKNSDARSALSQKTPGTIVRNPNFTPPHHTPTLQIDVEPTFDPSKPLRTLADINKAIEHYQQIQLLADASQIADINDRIATLEAERQRLLELTNNSAPDSLPETPAYSVNLNTLRGINAEIARQRELRLDASKTEIAGIDAEIARLQSLAQAFNSVADAQQNTADKGSLLMGAISNVSSLMRSLSGVVGESASSWLQWGTNILNSVAQALPLIAQLIGGNIAQAFAGAAAQSQSVPFPYNLVALAASMSAVGAAVASIPKFANGGIAYGPTVGLFGEYAGARSNPEVVAPLNRLRQLVAPDPTNQSYSMPAEITLRADGRSLVAVLDRQLFFNHRVNNK